MHELKDIHAYWYDEEQTYLKVIVGDVAFGLLVTEACQLHDELTFASAKDGYIRRHEDIWACYAVDSPDGWTINIGRVDFIISDDDAARLLHLLDVMI